MYVFTYMYENMYMYLYMYMYRCWHTISHGTAFQSFWRRASPPQVINPTPCVANLIGVGLLYLTMHICHGLTQVERRARTWAGMLRRTPASRPSWPKYVLYICCPCTISAVCICVCCVYAARAQCGLYMCCLGTLYALRPPANHGPKVLRRRAWQWHTEKYRRL